MKTAICWFKNDLRVDDNPALTAAAQADRLLCVYVIDARHNAASRYGPPKLGAHRRAFLRQSPVDLRQRLEAIGSRLHVVAGEAEDELPRLAACINADTIHTTAEFAPEERTSVDRVARALDGVRIEEHEGGGLYDRDELPFDLDDMPRVHRVS